MYFIRYRLVSAGKNDIEIDEDLIEKLDNFFLIKNMKVGKYYKNLPLNGEKRKDVAKLNDFDLDKFRNMQNISGNIVKPPVTQPAPTENYQPVGIKPPETNINQLINSGGF